MDRAADAFFSGIAQVCFSAYSRHMTPNYELREGRIKSDPTLGPSDKSVADGLWNGVSSGATIPPLRLAAANSSLAAGYRVQAINVRRWKSVGRQVVGHKIGMTTAAIQKQFSYRSSDPRRTTRLDDISERCAAQFSRWLFTGTRRRADCFCVATPPKQRVTDVG